MLASATLIASTLVPAAAGAQPFSLGLTDPVFASPDNATRAQWLDRAVDSRAQVILSAASWAGIAPADPSASFDPTDPADPGYDFTGLDAALRDQVARGLEPMLLVTGAPLWAEGANRPGFDKAAAGTWKPQPAKLKAFGKAIASRYSGSFNDPGDAAGTLPRVRDYQLWAEPNLAIYLTPQWKKRQPASPSHYRKMLRGFYEGIHSVSGSNRVVSGGTAPYGDPQPGGERIQPVLFWRELLCLKGQRLRTAKCKRPAKFDVWAHHPINVGKPRRQALNRDDASTPDLGKIERVVKKAVKTGRALPKRKKPLWATEIWWDSKPPDPNGVVERKHARWLAESFYLLWKQGAERVVWFLIKDVPSGGDFGATPQSGLYLAGGKPKLAQQAFRFPFVADQIKDRRIRIWGVAPSPGKVSIERKSGKQWKRLGASGAKRSGVFTDSVRAKRGSLLRARQGSSTSVPFKAK